METQTETDLLTTRQACDLINRLTGERPDADTVRRWCKEGLGGPLDRDPIILECTRNKLGHFVIRRAAIEQFVAQMAGRKAELAEFDAWRVMRKVNGTPPGQINGQAQEQSAVADTQHTPLETLAHAIGDRQTVHAVRRLSDRTAPSPTEQHNSAAVWVVLILVGLALAVVGWLTAGFNMLEPFAVLGLSTSVIGLGGLLWTAR